MRCHAASQIRVVMQSVWQLHFQQLTYEIIGPINGLVHGASGTTAINMLPQLLATH